GPDVSLDLPLFSSLLTGLLIDDGDHDLDLFNTILTQRDSIAFSDTALLQSRRQTNTPKPMDRTVVGFHIGIRAFLGILILRPELRIAGFDEFTGNASRMIGTQLLSPFR